MKSVEEVLNEPAPSTVAYRSKGTRSSLQQLIDSVAAPDVNRAVVDEHGTSSSSGSMDGGEFGSEKDGGSVGSKGGDVANGAGGGAAPVADKLDWVKGVFVPCLLNIWGVIMFLRLGWVVGQAGILLACLVVFCSKVVTTLTALSLCAICTNGEVKGGGVYFLISRALGPVYGGVIGILFFFAQAVATSLYVIGFAESIVFLMNDVGSGTFTGSELNDIRVIGLGTTVLLLGVAMIGVGWYAKCQLGLLVTLVVSMISVIIGAFFPGVPNLEENRAAGFVDLHLGNIGSTFVEDPATPGLKQNFFTVFAVFFPAATGVMAGANLSGDLKDPSSAIPKGTLGAIGVTFISYIGLIWIVGTAGLICSDPLEGPELCPLMFTTSFNSTYRPTGGLIYNKLIMQNMSIWAPLLYVGVFAATLSSALASLVGAPRILQSVAGDKIFPWAWFNYFGQGKGVNNEPIRAYILTFVITCCCVVIGKLDVIAPLISNFFMVSYAFTNYACFASSFAKYPGWRPSFKYYNKWLSLFGFFICLVVMFLMDIVTSVVTVVVAALIYGYLLWLNPAVNWGAAGEARQYLSVLGGMQTLQRMPEQHVKTYRPQYLVLSGNPEIRRSLIKFVSLLSKGGGVMICGDVVLKSEIESSLVNSGQKVPAVSRIRKQGSMTLESVIEEEDEEEEEEEEETEQEQQQQGTPEKKQKQDSSPVVHHHPSIREEQEKLLEKGDDQAHCEFASRLAANLKEVERRRNIGEEFLANRSIFGGKGCKGAFFESVIGDSLLGGFQSLLQTSGLGRMRPNTVVIGYKKNWQNESLSVLKEYEQIIRVTLSSNLGIMIVRDDNNQFDFDFVKAGRELEIMNRCVRGKNGNSDKDKQKSSVQVPTSETDVRLDIPSAAITTTTTTPYNGLDGDTIDVWWVSDDGGLTMLIPYLLSVHRLMRKKQKLRVLTVTDYNVQETSKLQKTEFRMVHLLQKFRIDANVDAVEANLNSKAEQKTVDEFESLCHLSMSQLTVEEQHKTNRILRLVELVRERTSKRTSSIFITLPIPDTGIPVGLYMAWLHLLSTDMPPMVMMRGNNEHVLTFIC